MKRHPTLKVPDAMKLADFTPEECKCPKMQMRVRRRLGPKKSSTRPFSVDVQSAASTVSLLTSSSESASAASSSMKSAPKSKAKAPAKFPCPRKEQKRLTSVKKQKTRVEGKRARQHEKQAHKHATTWYAREMEKKQKGETETLSAAKIEALVRKDFDGVGPSARTIQREFKAGRAGMSPLKKGEKGEIPEGVFKTLCTVFESFVSIAQFNGSGGELTRTKLRARVYKAMNQQEDRISFTLLERILKETAVDLFAAKMNNVEERRILWTTYHNLMVRNRPILQLFEIKCYYYILNCQFKITQLSMYQ